MLLNRSEIQHPRENIKGLSAFLEAELFNIDSIVEVRVGRYFTANLNKTHILKMVHYGKRDKSERDGNSYLEDEFFFNRVIHEHLPTQISRLIPKYEFISSYLGYGFIVYPRLDGIHLEGFRQHLRYEGKQVLLGYQMAECIVALHSLPSIHFIDSNSFRPEKKDILHPRIIQALRQIESIHQDKGLYELIYDSIHHILEHFSHYKKDKTLCLNHSQITLPANHVLVNEQQELSALLDLEHSRFSINGLLDVCLMNALMRVLSRPNRTHVYCIASLWDSFISHYICPINEVTFSFSDIKKIELMGLLMAYQQAPDRFTHLDFDNAIQQL